MARRWIEHDLSAKARVVIKRAREYHERYYAAQTFTGPSLHFHRRALGLCRAVGKEERPELIYAVLTAWGMHRMGSTGSKMLPFERFQASMDAVAAHVAALKSLHPSELDDRSWAVLEQLFKRIKVMASGTTIVGNSKVLAHLLPNLVAPVDRQYTFAFLFGRTALANHIDREWLLLRKILTEFFYPVAADASFRKLAKGWMAKSEAYPWDTSILKVVDNLVIGARGGG